MRFRITRRTHIWKTVWTGIVLPVVLCFLCPANSAVASDEIELPSLPGIAFVLIEDSTIPWKAWGETAAGDFSFMFDRVGDPEKTPERVLVILPGDPSRPCFLEAPLRESAALTSTILIQPILEPDVTLTCGSEDPLIDVCRSIRQACGIPPEKVILVGEDARTRTVLTLATNHRAEFGGIISWEGDPGAALPLNLTETSIALLGDREELGAFTLFVKQCDEFSVPFRMNSYWGEVQNFELVDDLKVILNWMAQPEPRTIGRELAHSTYLPRYGKYGWIWITQSISPGLPGSVHAHWTRTSLVEFRAEGVKRFRVNLDTQFERYGKKIYFNVGNLSLPITLSRGTEAIEFEYSPERNRWNARFMKFDEPYLDPNVSGKVPPGYEKGETIEGFAALTRIETDVECAWNNRFPSDIPNEILSIEKLYCLVPPHPIVRVDWTFEEIDRFDRWLQSQRDLGFENSFAPGVRSNAVENKTKKVECAIPFLVLERYSRSSSIPLAEDLEVIDNFQHLLGLYLSRQHLPTSASL